MLHCRGAFYFQNAFTRLSILLFNLKQKFIMKKILYISYLWAIIFSACKKQAADSTIHLSSSPPYLTAAQVYLKQQMNPIDYTGIDFGQYHVSKDTGCSYLRVAFKNKPLSTDFILLLQDTTGRPLTGKIIHIETRITDKYLINGTIQLVSLDRKSTMNSVITNGYVESWHPAMFANNTKSAVIPGPSYEYPEVIVYAYYPSQSTSYIFDTYLALQSMFSGGNGSAMYPDASLYSHVDVTDYGSGSTATSTNPSSSLADGHADYYANIENSPGKPGIDLDAWLKCFTNIPDDGATCSITICADLPVDNDPTANVNFYSGATGHCFMELKKTNGAQSVTQVIGFTAQDPLAAIIHGDEFVPGKLVDNAGHKYDASITMNINASAFNIALEEMKLLSANPAYSITRFDCLDFDLAVFNSIRRNNPLTLPKMYNTGSTWDVVSTGERFYEMLSDMKQYGDPEAANIYVGGPVYIGNSHGPCN